MKALHVSLAVILTLVGTFVVVSQSAAENAVLKKECENKAQEAAELIKKIGPESAFKIITDPDGSFISKNSHVFCIDINSGKVLAHKYGWAVGFDMHNYKDSRLESPYTTILNLAQNKSSGWVTYMTCGTGPEKRAEPALKNMHYYRVAGTDIVLCCGYWEDA